MDNHNLTRTTVSSELMSHGKAALYGCNGEVRGLVPLAGSYAYSAFLIFELFVSVFGNSLVCIAIVRFAHLQTLTNSFIFSLGVTDLLTPFIRVFFVAVATLRHEWIFGCFWCKLSSVLGVFLCASSILHLCAISVERSVVIRWPLRQHLMITKRRVICVLSIIWMASLLVSLFPYFGIVKLAFNAELLDCEIYWMENPKMAILLACSFFLLPFLLMSVTYYFIFQEVKKQTQKISMLQVSKPDPEGIERKGAVSSRLRVIRILCEELKAVKIIVVVIGLFFVSWLPIFTVTCVRAYRPEIVSGGIQRFAFATAYSNSSCNWVVYSIMNKELRKAFKKMLLPFICCQQPRREFPTRPVSHDLQQIQAKSDASTKERSTDSLRSHGGAFRRANKVYAVESRSEGPTLDRTWKSRSEENGLMDLRKELYVIS